MPGHCLLGPKLNTWPILYNRSHKDGPEPEISPKIGTRAHAVRAKINGQLHVKWGPKN